MADWNDMQAKFALIAAKAELMRRAHTRPWASDIQQAAGEIAKYAGEILQDARQFEAGDR